jgi:hypothetical protein
VVEEELRGPYASGAAVHPQHELVRPNVDDDAKLAGLPDGVRVAAVVEGNAELKPVNRLGLWRRGGRGRRRRIWRCRLLDPMPLAVSTAALAAPSTMSSASTGGWRRQALGTSTAAPSSATSTPTSTATAWWTP